MPIPTYPPTHQRATAHSASFSLVQIEIRVLISPYQQVSIKFTIKLSLRFLFLPHRQLVITKKGLWEGWGVRVPEKKEVVGAVRGSQIEKVFIGRLFNQRLQILSTRGRLTPPPPTPTPPTSSVSHYEGRVISTQTGH